MNRIPHSTSAHDLDLRLKREGLSLKDRLNNVTPVYNIWGSNDAFRESLSRFQFPRSDRSDDLCFRKGAPTHRQEFKFHILFRKEGTAGDGA